MTRQTRRAGAFLVALGGAVAVLALLAGPASAQATSQTSGGALATGGSVASGEAVARNNSTASGDAVAIDNSTASGCSTAINNSTASGADGCGPAPTTPRPPTGGGGGGGGAAGGGTTTAARLAVTGSWSAPMLALAALAVAFGAWLMVAASDRRRAVKA